MSTPTNPPPPWQTSLTTYLNALTTSLASNNLKTRILSLAAIHWRIGPQRSGIFDIVVHPGANSTPGNKTFQADLVQHRRRQITRRIITAECANKGLALKKLEEELERRYLAEVDWLPSDEESGDEGERGEQDENVVVWFVDGDGVLWRVLMGWIFFFLYMGSWV